MLNVFFSANRKSYAPAGSIASTACICPTTAVNSETGCLSCVAASAT